MAQFSKGKLLFLVSYSLIFCIRQRISDGVLVAIKVLDLEASDEDIVEIQKEISVLSACDCAHVTRYHSSFIVNMALWIVMDYAGGGSVREILRVVTTIAEPYIVSITKGMLQALIYLHSNNIIHRDIKG